MSWKCFIFLKSFLTFLSANPTKWSNKFKQLVANSRQIAWVCLTILWGWRLKGLFFPARLHSNIISVSKDNLKKKDQVFPILTNKCCLRFFFLENKLMTNLDYNIYMFRLIRKYVLCCNNNKFSIDRTPFNLTFSDI